MQEFTVKQPLTGFLIALFSMLSRRATNNSFARIGLAGYFFSVLQFSLQNLLLSPPPFANDFF